MKGFAFVLLCALVAVQARHTGVQKTSSVEAALGENPWLVHLRIAVSTSGLLNTCSGSLIDSQWLLTAASCVEDSRFIWTRYGAVNVINPSLVTENSLFSIHPDNEIALININRVVQTTENIAPITLSTDANLPSTGKVCIFGEDNGAPGEILACQEGDLEEVSITKFDIGAPVVADGVQVGVVIATTDDGKIERIAPVADYLEWIQEETGIAFNPDVVPEIAPEAVKIVN